MNEVPSDRWEVALDLLVSGGGMFVLPGEVPVGMQRCVGCPGADGRVHVSIFTGVEPSAVTAEMAHRDVAAGLATVARVAAADARLTDLFARHGVLYDYVYDYGDGAVRIGDVQPDGLVQLL